MSTLNISVTKRHGAAEPFDLAKLEKVLYWATDNLDNVSISQVMMKSRIQFTDGISTETIHDVLTRTASDLISAENPNYQYVAARLAMFQLRKDVYGDFVPCSLLEQIKKGTDIGVYDKHILRDYTEEEINLLDTYINHDLDMTLAYAAVKQLTGKYLVQNRVTKEIYETPQFLYMLVSMCLFHMYPKDTRIGYVKRFYDASSSGKISLPTPIMAGVRTPSRQFSSCVLIDVDDSLDSINASASSVVKYISQRAGIGLNVGRIRALGSPIRGGEAVHTGCIPFYKHFQSAVKSCSQGKHCAPISRNVN